MKLTPAQRRAVMEWGERTIKYDYEPPGKPLYYLGGGPACFRRNTLEALWSKHLIHCVTLSEVNDNSTLWRLNAEVVAWVEQNRENE